MTKLQVTGNLAEVAELLQGALTAQELAALRIEPGPAPSPFAPGARRGEPLSTTVLVWIAGTVASGMAYDAMKALSIKVYELLRARYGNDKVKKDESGR